MKKTTSKVVSAKLPPRTVPDSKGLHDIAHRLQSGTGSLINESRALGFTHNGPLRTALKTLLGAAAYGELMKGKRPAGFANFTPTAVDDSSAKRIDSATIRTVLSEAVVSNARRVLEETLHVRATAAHEQAALAASRTNASDVVARAQKDAKWKGWRAELGKGDGQPIMLTGPDGVRYRPAHGNTSADVVITYADDAFTPTRYRRVVDAPAKKAAPKVVKVATPPAKAKKAVTKRPPAKKGGRVVARRK